jgi:hypothetical protein
MPLELVIQSSPRIEEGISMKHKAYIRMILFYAVAFIITVEIILSAISYFHGIDGTWAGRTSNGDIITMRIRNSNVISIHTDYVLYPSTSRRGPRPRPVGQPILFRDINIPINSNRFSHLVGNTKRDGIYFAGEFTSNLSCYGTWADNSSHIFRPALFTWSARKRWQLYIPSRY